MKKLLSLIAILPFMTFCQNKELSETEKRMETILDSLNQAYLWQPVREDMMSSIPPAGYIKKYPHRVKLYAYLNEVDSLSKKDLSQQFLIQIFDTVNFRKLNFYNLTDKLLTFKTETAYNKLFTIFSDSSTDYQLRRYIGLGLIRNNQFKDQIRQYILTSNLHDTMTFAYLKQFDEATDKLILKRIVDYMKLNLKETPSKSFSYVLVLENYYDKKFEEDLNKYFGKNHNGEKLEKARTKFYRKSAENALQYYDGNNNE
ncbi:hypothetical protein J2X31_003614 [Flavobacterium arsenatis]|uniref:Lipoprotein n=1 Tax=Flavobacterium arsenatis TaxID=1484332 RepID=A0ABU1TUP2_9FLAO|nr:hypothetical protein [Flavobacterium arsenatis]MDR6969581.1 hypothetical protein [Flavobacterium arsenatis]